MGIRTSLYAILLSSTVLTTVGMAGGSFAQTITPTSSTLKDAVNNLDNGTTTSETIFFHGNNNTYDTGTPDGYRVTKGSLTIYQDPNQRGNVYGSLGVDGPSSTNRASLTLYGIGVADMDAGTVTNYWTNLHDGATTATDPALLATNANLSITGVVFANSNNITTDTVYGNGGAIKLNENTTTTIDQSVFYNNKTQKYGGAIDIDNDSARVTQLQRTVFMNNSAAIHGGALDVDGSLQNMSDNLFTGNTSAKGGAIYVDGGTVIGSNNVFKNNTATGNGGAIYVGVDSGDGLSPSSQAGTLALTDTTFTGNKAVLGGAVYNDGGNASITGGTISENIATDGAGVYNAAGDMTVSNVKISNNTATRNGGAVYNAGHLVVSGSTVLSGNTANLGSNAYNASSGTLTVSDVHDNIDLDYEPFTTTTRPSTMTTIFDQSGDIYNAGTLNFLNSEIQLHNGINTNTTLSDTARKVGSVNVQNSTIDLGGYNVPGNGTIYADKVNIKQDSEIRTHVRKATDDYGKIVANNISVDPNNTNLKLYYNMVDALKKGETQIYTILDGTVAGDFEKAMANQSLYTVEKLGNGRYKVSYTGSSPDSGKDLLCPGCDQNEMNTAEGWEIYDTPDSDKLMPEGTEAREIQQELWEGHNKPGYREALDGLAPDVSPLIQAHATEITRRLSAIVSERFYNSMERTGYVHNGKRFYRFPRHDSNLWVQGLYGKSKYDVRKGWDMDTKGIAIGFDGHVSEALRMGLSYAYTKADGDSVQRDTTIDSHTGMVYGEYNPNRFYANWLAMYTRSEYDEEKKVYDHRIKANYDVDAVGAQVMFGRKMGPYVSGNWASGVIKPELGLRYIYTKQHGYTDSVGQKVGSADGQTLTGILGAQYTIAYALSPSLSWYPEFRAALTYDIVEPDTKTRVNLLNGSTYEVKTENMDRFGIEVGAKVGLDINRKVEVALEYEGLFKGDYTNHTGLANLKYKF